MVSSHNQEPAGTTTMPLFSVFTNLPIERKLLLVSVIPVLTLIILSLVIFRSVQTFSSDEDRLNHVYHVQTTAAEYMRLVVDLETGFRGFVMTAQPQFLKPYRAAKTRVLTVGHTLEQMVRDHEAQRILVESVQKLIQQLMGDKDQLIEKVNRGQTEEAYHYIEAGSGRALMSAIREEMARFDRREVQLLREALLSSAEDRSFLMGVIVGGGVLALGLMMVPLHLIARSITGPLVSLAKTVSSAPGGTVPDVPVLERGDEIGSLTRGMQAMSTQLRQHIHRIENSEAELRALNQSLSASESKYRGIVDHAPFGIFTAQGPRIIFSNRHNWVLAGRSPDEARDPEDMWKAIHPEDRDRVVEVFTAAIEQRVPFESVFRFLHADGNIRKILSRAVPIQDGDHQHVMYQGFNVDITALEQMRERLSRAERLATLGQVAAGIAHEIRNPLVGIGSTASLLLEEFPQGDTRQLDVGTILKETRRLDRIVNQIVEYARPRGLVPASVAIGELLDESMRLLREPLRAKSVEVDLPLHRDLPLLQADRDQLKQVFLNVLHNAIDAVSPGGRVRISASKAFRDSEPGILIEVEDNGKGIAPGDLPRVFEPFFTTGKLRGTGLGLAICRNIIDAHRGDIQVRSQSNVGTVVSIWVPLSQQLQTSDA